MTKFNKHEIDIMKTILTECQYRKTDCDYDDDENFDDKIIVPKIRIGYVWTLSDKLPAIIRFDNDAYPEDSEGLVCCTAYTTKQEEKDSYSISFDVRHVGKAIKWLTANIPLKVKNKPKASKFVYAVFAKRYHDESDKWFKWSGDYNDIRNARVALRQARQDEEKTIKRDKIYKLMKFPNVSWVDVK